MQQANGEKTKTDEDNAKVFADHFSKVFNNQNPLTCNHSALDLIPQSPDFLILAAPLTLDEVKAALKCMANGKAPDPSGVLSDALKSM
eukprot:11259470-Ditylum_brightwellii.AAC.1